MLCSDGEHRREGDKEFGGAAAKGGEALSRRKVAISALARAPLPGGPLAHKILEYDNSLPPASQNALPKTLVVLRPSRLPISEDWI